MKLFETKKSVFMFVDLKELLYMGFLLNLNAKVAVQTSENLIKTMLTFGCSKNDNNTGRGDSVYGEGSD